LFDGQRVAIRPPAMNLRDHTIAEALETEDISHGKK